MYWHVSFIIKHRLQASITAIFSQIFSNFQTINNDQRLQNEMNSIIINASYSTCGKIRRNRLTFVLHSSNVSILFIVWLMLRFYFWNLNKRVAFLCKFYFSFFKVWSRTVFIQGKMEESLENRLFLNLFAIKQ